jgi:hypothetical protein
MVYPENGTKEEKARFIRGLSENAMDGFGASDHDAEHAAIEENRNRRKIENMNIAKAYERYHALAGTAHKSSQEAWRASYEADKTNDPALHDLAADMHDAAAIDHDSIANLLRKTTNKGDLLRDYMDHHNQLAADHTMTSAMHVSKAEERKGDE